MNTKFNNLTEFKEKAKFFFLMGIDLIEAETITGAKLSIHRKGFDEFVDTVPSNTKLKVIGVNAFNIGMTITRTIEVMLINIKEILSNDDKSKDLSLEKFDSFITEIRDILAFIGVTNTVQVISDKDERYKLYVITVAWSNPTNNKIEIEQIILD